MKHFTLRHIAYLLLALIPCIAYAGNQNYLISGKYLAVVSEWEEEAFTLDGSIHHWEFIFPEEGTITECDGKYKISDRKLVLYNRICTFVRNDPNNPPPYKPEKKKDRSYPIRNITEKSFELNLVKDEYHDDDKGWVTFNKQ